jgi:hypothetical protein
MLQLAENTNPAPMLIANFNGFFGEEPKLPALRYNSPEIRFVPGGAQ